MTRQKRFTFKLHAKTKADMPSTEPSRPKAYLNTDQHQLLRITTCDNSFAPKRKETERLVSGTKNTRTNLHTSDFADVFETYLLSPSTNMCPWDQALAHPPHLLTSTLPVNHRTTDAFKQKNVLQRSVAQKTRSSPSRLFKKTRSTYHTEHTPQHMSTFQNKTTHHFMGENTPRPRSYGKCAHSATSVPARKAFVSASVTTPTRHPRTQSPASVTTPTWLPRGGHLRGPLRDLLKFVVIVL